MRRPPRSLEADTYLSLVQTHDVLHRTFVQFFKEHGLSPPLYNALRIVRGAGEDGVRTRQIGERLLTREPDVTRLVDRLEQKGWVERVRCGEDRRVIWVHLTEAGRAKLAELDEPVEALHQQQLGHLGREFLERLRDDLARARGDGAVDAGNR